MTIQAAIVCVDDDLNVLQSLGDQLKRYFGQKYDIELASSGEDALTLCSELFAEGKTVPLIISDQRMNGIEGDELLIRLHSLYPKTIKIMLTGQADANSVGNVVNASALYRYISKPWNETDLILIVSEALCRFERDLQLCEQNELLKNTNVKLNNSLSLLLATLESTVDGILILDNSRKVISFNQKFSQIWTLGNSEDNLRNSDPLPHVLAQINESDAHHFKRALEHSQSDQRKILTLRNGRTVEYHLRPQQLMGEIVGQVWSFRDISQELEEQELLKYQAWHDSLTRLPNRLLFGNKLDAELMNAKQQNQMFCIMFLDLDHFKQVNDSYGHAIGDLLLQKAVQRFLGCLRDSDVLGRWGGDEFVLLIPRIKSLEDAQAIAQKLVETIRPHFSLLEEYNCSVSVSIGYAIYPYDGHDSSTLVHHADLALYQAKRAGKNQYRHYHTGMTASVQS